MSKITINAILVVLRLVLSLIAKCIRLLYSVSDLVDDGCLNNSASRPDWMVNLSFVIETLESLRVHTSSIQEEVSETSIPFPDVKD